MEAITSRFEAIATSNKKQPVEFSLQGFGAASLGNRFDWGLHQGLSRSVLRCSAVDGIPPIQKHHYHVTTCKAQGMREPGVAFSTLARRFLSLAPKMLNLFLRGKCGLEPVGLVWLPRENHGTSILVNGTKGWLKIL